MPRNLNTLKLFSHLTTLTYHKGCILGNREVVTLLAWDDTVLKHDQDKGSVSNDHGHRDRHSCTLLAPGACGRMIFLPYNCKDMVYKI